MNKIGPEFDRGDLAREIAARYGDDLDNAKTQEDAVLVVLKGLAAILPDALAELGRVDVHELGVFAVVPKYRQVGEDENGSPLFEATGEERVTFRPAPFLKSILEQRRGVAG